MNRFAFQLKSGEFIQVAVDEPLRAINDALRTQHERDTANSGYNAMLLSAGTIFIMLIIVLTINEPDFRLWLCEILFPDDYRNSTESDDDVGDDDSDDSDSDDDSENEDEELTEVHVWPIFCPPMSQEPF